MEDAASQNPPNPNPASLAIAPIIAQNVQARSLYWRGWAISQIADELGLPYATVSSWKVRHKWDQASAIERAEEGTLERYLMLIAKEQKTGSDYKEIDLLGRQFERMARQRKYLGEGGNEVDLNPDRAKGARATNKKKDKTKNLITPEMAAQLRADLETGLFGHQSVWLTSTSLRTRMILKSRQIGATWYFARERLLVALETGKNQIFISASRAQANIFRNYIVQWVQKVCGIELKGDPMVIQRGADEDGTPIEAVTLYFLGTNYRTAQGYTGDVIIDECFWIYGFEELFKVASAIATHKQFTRTLFSTPSTLAHEAHPMWTGERVNKRRAKRDRIKIDISHDHLKAGALGADNVWRQIVTVFDAIEGGFDLVDVEELQLEYAADEFDNLFRCIFLDDSQSMFPFALMRRCMVDSWDAWSRDFEPYALRPFGDGEVWIGYDPNASESATADEAALVAVAPPLKPGGKFRILEKQRIKGKDFEGQAAAIKDMAQKYRVTRIGIDTTGAGKAVHQLVSKWFPLAEAYHYSVHLKAQMVLKAKNVISAGRLEFDAGWMDVLQAFMAIKPEFTSKGVTYTADRAGGIGHADVAWAVMHAIYFEPLDSTQSPGGSSTMEIF
ncbi:terminase large subunit domain-containing protein [Novosphingobium pituita]|uniref:Terminase ATPase subunit family protein n=1 Tax=Novosphingobium pituita TaxID=3056842 RepID=A0ABQ6P6X3_9SPHN|nr:terminase family protein [Novosphingobium sp. IK01]GMM59876.1 terminase ATPase subunit family protein [Novosphingobium sp. IK01]